MNSFKIESLKFQNWGPFDLEIGPAECVGLTGDSGSGKTLFLRSLSDLDDNTGKVSLNGHSRENTPGPPWRRRVGMLPANPVWWCETVKEHFPMNLDQSESFEFLGFGPDVMDWEVSRLSTGEKQRLGLLRLLALEPKALLLDEPTANLDADNRGRIEDFISQYRARHDAPVLWVSHDLEQLDRVASRSFRIIDRQLQRLEGRKEEKGS